MLKRLLSSTNRVRRNEKHFSIFRALYDKNQLNDRDQKTDQRYTNWETKPYHFIGVGLAAAAGFAYILRQKQTLAYALENDVSKIVNVKNPGIFIDGLPVFTSDDVAQHQDEKAGIWITYKNGVYDITSFIRSHPGGNKILLAAGGSVEPFWSLYAVHQQPEILGMMEEFRIGNLAKGDELYAVANLDDPYANEPRRHPMLKVRSQKPFNAEPPPVLLVENFITPTDVFYVRNHLPVPEVDMSNENYTLEVVPSQDGIGAINLNLEDLKTKFPQHIVTAALQCAGNRRSEMNLFKPVKGLAWSQGAMGNATWKGPKLRDVLLGAGFKDNQDYENLHVRFDGLDTDPTSMPYGASIPLAKAMDPRGDVILAYEMNGEVLNRDHGFPLRVIVPGSTGARWVKWLTRIEVSKEESESHWQRNDYKSFSPSTDWDKVDFSNAAAIQEMPVTSVICDPQNGETVTRDTNGNAVFRGYAWSGGGRAICRVDISIDRGLNWQVAKLVDLPINQGPNRHWAWTRWQVELPIKKDGEVDVWVRAVDSSYNTQPENMDHIWNLRGLMAVAYHKIKISVLSN